MRATSKIASLACLLVACAGCTRRPEGGAAVRDARAVPAAPAPDAAAPGPAADAAPVPPPAAALPPLVQDPELAERIRAASNTAEPYARWLLGLPGGAETWPPSWAIDALHAAAVPAAAIAAATVPDLTRMPDTVVVSARLEATPEREPCAGLVSTVGGVLTADGFTALPPDGADDSASAFQSVGADGIKRVVSFGCTDAHQQNEPGCTPPCTRPTTVTVEYGISMPAPTFRTFAEAFGTLPPVFDRLRTKIVPPFLADRMTGQHVAMMDCEALEGRWCANFTFLLEPPAELKQWVLDTIDLAAAHGFRCDERYKDPEHDWIASTQDCSGMNLGYSVQNDRLMVHLGAIIGAAAGGNAVDCSRDFRPPADAGAAEPDVLAVMDMPVTRRTSEHILHVAECWDRHQRDAGREPQDSVWQRAGGYLSRRAWVAGADRGIEVGTHHEAYETGPADGFYARANAPLADGHGLELYAEQEDFTTPGGRLQLDLKDANGASLFTLTVDLADAATGLGSAAELVRRANAAIDDAFTRETAGTDQVQECRVLPNRGQQCSSRPATADEQARAVSDAEATRTRRKAYVADHADALFAAVADLYPFADTSCALAVPAGPR